MTLRNMIRTIIEPKTRYFQNGVPAEATCEFAAISTQVCERLGVWNLDVHLHDLSWLILKKKSPITNTYCTKS